MKVCVRLLLAAVLLLPSLALAGDKDEMEGVGFSDDGTLFAYFTFGVFDGRGSSHAELNAFSTLTGRRNDEASRSLVLEDDGGRRAALDKLKASEAGTLKDLKLGRDKGLEMYRSGTALATAFTVAGHQVQVRLDVRKGTPDAEKGTRDDSVSVRLGVDGKWQTLYVGRGGWDYSLNSIRLSADQRSLAVLVRHSTPGFEGKNRRYLCAAGRLALK